MEIQLLSFDRTHIHSFYSSWMGFLANSPMQFAITSLVLERMANTLECRLLCSSNLIPIVYEHMDPSAPWVIFL